MERDFMGLNSKDSAVVVKEEAVELYKDSGALWVLSSKVSALPPFMPFKASQDEKMPKVMSDHLASSGFMAMSSTDAFDVKRGEIQGLHPLNRAQDAKKLPTSMGNPFLKTQSSGGDQNFSGATSKQQFIGGVPVSAPHSFLPSSSFVAGTFEPWFSTKAPGSTSQLTIFYGGSVNVFEDITPEKAQAIMFLAGNGCTPNVAQTRLPVPSPPAKFVAGDTAFVNQTINVQPGSGLSSPISVSSRPVGSSGVVSPNSDEAKAPKPSGCLTDLVNNKVETRNMVVSLGSVAANTIMQSAVPQARKASLARFLEKRKESRAMNSSPYSLDKKPAEGIKPDSMVAISVAGSGHV